VCQQQLLALALSNAISEYVSSKS